MKSTNYVAPNLEVIEIEVESAVLTVSGEHSTPVFGE